ncbi:DinB family protein [Ferdinandcohnia quinoae]|uniref:DinB family protein n=1 Tax=Fredinandcohnia quinoae TaxID=2918902 RepID=A0AAW5ECF5_9BACI|nr:DinB family protein [Fredinandcohnia sp. SECRCQ15]MCH1626454.1 DinB family protein [Fredinandcohnia sp. SECRCQ15]
MDMKQRKVWNENHKKLKEILLKPEEHSKAIQLFLSQHSLVHSSSIGKTGQVTLEDEVLRDLDESIFREYPVPNPDTNNSIAWHLWHIARIEDMTMNILVANVQQVLHTANWIEKMNLEFTHSGNDMSEEDIAALSERIDFNSLLAYRRAVGRQTQDIISALKPGHFKLQVDQKRINRLFDENSVMQNSKWLAEYWSKQNIAGLILMPATRHIFLHLNKCVRIKEKLQK